MIDAALGNKAFALSFSIQLLFESSINFSFREGASIRASKEVKKPRK